MEADHELLKAVRVNVDDREAQVLRRKVRPLGDGFADAMAGGEGLLLHTGIASTAHGEQHFELVEKVCRVIPTGSDPGSWLYWKREALAYQSGILHEPSGGVAAPRCYGVFYTAEPTARVFIEAVSDPQPIWDQRVYAIAAEALGVFSGNRLGKQDTDAHSWMAVGRAHSWLASADEILKELSDGMTDPVLSQWLSGSNLQRTLGCCQTNANQSLVGQ